MVGSQRMVLFLLILVMAAPMNVNAWVSTVVAATVCGGAAVFVAPVVISAAGFTTGGIAAGSLAASMMSTAAVANGGAVAAGGIVATLQWIGAGGLGYVGKAAVVTVCTAGVKAVFSTIG